MIRVNTIGRANTLRYKKRVQNDIDIRRGQMYVLPPYERKELNGGLEINEIRYKTRERVGTDTMREMKSPSPEEINRFRTMRLYRNNDDISVYSCKNIHQSQRHFMSKDPSTYVLLQRLKVNLLKDEGTLLVDLVNQIKYTIDMEQKEKLELMKTCKVGWYKQLNKQLLDAKARKDVEMIKEQECKLEQLKLLTEWYMEDVFSI